MHTLKLPSRPMGYLALFIGAYVLLEALYFLVPDNILREVVYHYGVVTVSADIIHLITPHEAVAVTANQLRSNTVALEVVRGCDGAGVAFLLIAAMAAFPATWRRKVTGSVMAITLVFVLNQVRIVGLYYLGVYRAGKGLGELCLAHPGHVFDESVAFGDEAEEDQLDRFSLALDHPLYVGDDGVEARPEPAETFRGRVGVGPRLYFAKSM